VSVAPRTAAAPMGEMSLTLDVTIRPCVSSM
jgi:hypothetical protein